MALSPLDIAVIVVFFAVNLGIGLWFARGSGKNIGEFFLSGRSAPWWLTGTSMVATTFAVDTPLAVTGFVAQNGIAGNWLWWNMAASGILTVFFFAALWRRSGVLTDVEFIELRYGGKPASWLRGVRAVYQGVLVNTIIMGWVNLAMVKILIAHAARADAARALRLPRADRALRHDRRILVGARHRLAAVHREDVDGDRARRRGGRAPSAGSPRSKPGSRASTRKHAAGGGGSILAFFPSGGDASWMPLTTFLVFVGVAWWASSYPGAEPGGGWYIAQRIFASRSEKNAVYATLFFNVAHYALRPVAVDPGRAGSARALPARRHRRERQTRSRAGLRADAGRLSAGRAARPDDGRLPGGIHVDDRHAAQPRRVVPHQRPLPALREPGRRATSTTSSLRAG